MTSKNKTASCPNSRRLRKFMVSEGNSALLTPIVDHLLGFTFIDFYAQKFFFPGYIKNHFMSCPLGNIEILMNQIKSFP